MLEPTKTTTVRKRKSVKPGKGSLTRLSKLDVHRLEEREVPAATFTGTVFLDTNQNGRFDFAPVTIDNIGAGTTTLSSEVGFNGRAQPWDTVRTPVTIRAFDQANTVAGTATTDVAGNYTLTVSGGGSYRLEFTNLPAGISYGPSGTLTGTALQTAGVVDNGSTGGLNLALTRYEDITPDNPLIATQRYIFGASNGAFADRGSLYAFPYNSGSSIPAPNPPGQFSPAAAGPFVEPTTYSIQVPFGEIGATWGLGYNKSTNQIYAAAFTKRHSGWGPGGPGAIYAVDGAPSGNNTQVTDATQLLDLETLAPGSTGTNFRNDPQWASSVPANQEPYIRDGLFFNANGSQAGWDAVGKSGLGGLDVDPTGRFLYTVALGDRRLYVVDLQNPNGTPTAVDLPIPISVTGGSGSTYATRLGDLRPFAVQYYKGSIYVGAVNSAESTTANGTVVGDPSVMRAYVFQYRLNVDANGSATGGGTFVDLNGNATTTAPVLDTPLNYNRGYIQPGIDGSPGQTPSAATVIPAEWLPWTPVYRNITNSNLPNIGFYPQAWLTGLAFDSDGNVTLGLRDRSGDQFGYQTPSLVSDPNSLFTGISGGDTLRAFLNQQSTGNVIASRWTLENNAASPGNTVVASGGVGNQQGPGNGEFYYGDYLQPGLNDAFEDHQELSVGGVLQLPGYDDVVVTTFDPAQVRQQYDAGGIRFYRNRAVNGDTSRIGDAVRGYQLYQTQFTFGQASDTFAKANGIGDLVAIAPTGMEIGNKVWADLNRDGRQDPTDPGLGSVRVLLFKDGASIAEATTDINGNYFFTSLLAPAANLRVPGKTYGVANLLPNMAYEVRIPLVQSALGALTLTTANISGNTEDIRDSDALAVGGNGVIALTTGGPGTTDHSFDAGFVYRLSLGDYVWNDRNNNGTWEQGEAPIGGVLVQLVNATDTVLATATTNAQGGYLFTNLNPGDYRVRIPTDPVLNPNLIGFLSSSGTNGQAVGAFEPANLIPLPQANNLDHGVTQPNGFVIASLVSLQPGTAPTLETTAPTGDLGLTDNAADADSDRTQDFGFYQPISIGDRVWFDRNNSGVRDPGEAAVVGASVILLDVTGPTATTVGTATTNANGGYLFTNLAPATYQVVLVRSGSLAGYRSSTGTVGRPTGPFEPVTTNTPNDTDHGTDAGGFINGPRLTAAVGGAIVVDPTTIPAGLQNDPAPATSRYRDQDFGVFLPLELGNLVWEDVNNNGLREAGEAGISGIVVELLDSAGNPLRDETSAPITTTTLADGTYLFSNLVPGDYVVRITPPAGYMSSSGVNGSSMSGPFEPGLPGNDLTDNADHGTAIVGSQRIAVRTPVTLFNPGDASNPDPLSSGEANRANLRQDFGLYRKVSIGDFVWDDFNNNGIYDAANGETGIGGVVVRLLDGAGNPVLGLNSQAIATTTAADGGYLFGDLLPGNYRVEVVIPTGFRSSSGTSGSLSGPFEPVTNPENPANNLDHGTTQVGGLVVRGPVVNAQLGQAPLDDLDGPASATAADTIANDSSYRNQDFGFFRPLAIGDLVFLDANNSGMFDPTLGETGIPNVTVILFDGTGTSIAQTTTNAGGLYRFENLTQGNYSVGIVRPTGLSSSTGLNNEFEPAQQNDLNDKDKGTTQPNGTIRAGQITLNRTGNPDENGSANLRQDFGLFVPTVPPPPVLLAIGDLVFKDTNNSGMFDPGEAPIAGVTVRLLSGDNRILATTTTDANGLYRFSDLQPGVYAVAIIPPAGLRSSTGTNNAFEPAEQNNLNDKDKGTTQADGSIRTGNFVLTAGTNPDEGGLANLRQDFGLIDPPVVPGVAMISGFVYVDANINGVRDAGERPIPGTRVYLNGTDDNGNVVALSQLTDTTGAYKFTNLVPGNYVLREQQPEGTLYDGLDTAGTIAGVVRGTTGNDILSAIRLNADDNSINNNFGEIPTAGTFGYVWYDINRNGIFEAGELPLSGVPVTISGTIFPGTPFARALTSADVPGGLTVLTNDRGRYDFPTLPYGVYRLTETQPVDYDDWQLQDGDPTSTSRPVMTTNMFTGVTLTASAPLRGPYNFGEVLSSSGQVPPTSPQVPPSKRDFLSSTRSPVATLPAAPQPAELPSFPGVVSPVSNLNLQPSFPATALSSTSFALVATGAGVGTAPIVRVFDYATGIEKFRFLAYEQAYTGGVRTAVGDINGDGVPDIVTGTGVGGGPRIRAFSGVDGSELANFFAYEPTYVGGLSVAIGDVNGDGIGEIITGTDQGGGPRVRILSLNGTSQPTVIADYFAFDSAQRGGVRVAAADINGDGRDDVIATTGAGVPTRVIVFDGATQTPIRDFAPYGSGFSGGVFVAAGDFNGDGTPDIITGADAGGGPDVRAFDGRTGATIAGFFAFESTFVGGVRVASLDINGDGRSEIVTAAGSGGGARVTVYSGAGVQVLDDFFAFDATNLGGSFVGAGTVARRQASSAGTPVAAGNLARPQTLADLPATNPAN